MYKGYIPTYGKKPIEKVKDRTEFYSLEEVENLKSYGGVLADDILMLDIDDLHESDILYKIVQDKNIKCKVVKTTRGKHFYFKNSIITKNSIHTNIAIGLNADIKIGKKNSVAPIRINGVDREVLIDIPSDEFDEIPNYLLPIKKKVSITDMTEGDGRNQTLFNYILTLQGEGYSKDAIREIIGIINEYILAEPLPEKELETILRDEAFTKESFFKGATLLHDKFASFLKNEERIIKIEGMLNIYKDGVYHSKQSDIEAAMIKHIPILTKSKRAEVLAYLELICNSKNLTVDRSIVLENGILNIDTLELREFDPDYICKNKINHKYVADAYNETLDKTLDKIACYNKDLRLLMEEMIGYCLFRRNELGKFFILTGSGSNGKSTFLNLINHLLGKENISSIAMEELQQRFKTAELFGKLTNLGDDISGNYIDDNAVLKKLVTGETVNVERKGKDPFDFVNYSKLIFSANNIPRINDTSDGLMRRIVIVPFKAKFSDKDADYDPWIMDKLLTEESMQYLLKIAIEGLKRLLKNRKFTNVESVVEEMHEYERLNNPVIAFLEEFEVNREPTKEVYLKYSTWCIENRLRPLSNIQFGKELSNRGYSRTRRRIAGKPTYIFIKGESEDEI